MQILQVLGNIIVKKKARISINKKNGFLSKFWFMYELFLFLDFGVPNPTLKPNM